MAKLKRLVNINCLQIKKGDVQYETQKVYCI